MPFDGSGNFTRNYNFQQDRDNGIKILAARMDGEFDNFATGMNLVFFRDGRVPLSADLRMGINRITGLADGSVASPAIKFNTDASTGPYLDGLSRYGISVNGVQRSVHTSAGVDITGNLTATGTISEGGTLLSTKYAPYSNPNFATNVSISGAGGALTMIPRDGTTGNTIVYSNTANQLRFQQAGTDQLVVTSSGVTIAPNATMSGNLTVNGTLTGASTGKFQGSVTVDGASNSFRSLFFTASGGAVASVDLLNDNSTVRYNAPTTHRLDINGTQAVAVTNLIVTSVDLSLQRTSNANTGALYFGPSSNNRYIFYDGSNYTLNGASSTQFLNNGFYASAGAATSYCLSSVQQWRCD
jgi:hypothetical protein